MNHPELVDSLNWRYATKRFDPSKKIPEEVWEALESSLLLAPSSYGLQPWRFVVVNDPELRAKLAPACFNQPQVTEASHLVVFLAKRDVTEADIDRYLARISEVRGATLDSLKGYRDMMTGSLLGPGSKDRIPAWAAHQAYLALGVFLASAAVLGVDSCPMEGFSPAKVDKLLGLVDSPWRSVVIVTAGYRADSDALARLPKVRFSADEIIEHR